MPREIESEESNLGNCNVIPLICCFGLVLAFRETGSEDSAQHAGGSLKDQLKQKLRGVLHLTLSERYSSENG